MAHTYFKNDLITVSSDGVRTQSNYYKLGDLGPTRSLPRRTKHIVAVDITSNTGTVLESILFTKRDSEALNAVNAINEALAQTPATSSPTLGHVAPPVVVTMPPAKERDSFEWIGIIATSAIAVVVILWLLTVIF